MTYIPILVIWFRLRAIIDTVIPTPQCIIDLNVPNAACKNCTPLRELCIRAGIDPEKLYRHQNTPSAFFSSRWKSLTVKDIRKWVSVKERIIEVSVEYVDAPYKLKVKQFVPAPGDNLRKQWTKNGQVVYFPVPPYAIAAMEEAAVAIDNMVRREVWNFVSATLYKLKSDNLVWSTYVFAFQRVGNARTEVERILLTNTFLLWVLCRIHSNSERIVGEDTLGTQAVADPDSPYHGSVPGPPVLMAQLECIHYSKFLEPLSVKVVQDLKTLMGINGKEYWCTIYLTLFMLLHSCSMTTKRDMEYASLINLSATYCNPNGIRGHNHGSKILLAHFHLALKGGIVLKSALEEGLQAENGLTPTDMDFLHESVKQAAACKKDWDPIRASGDWGNQYYWIAQLYDEDWKPGRHD
ncbi:unnamed protein product [Clonostachys rosea]|uniref:Uncharacterized protein n=1 Tax=Bionectria ochroleuca TaxID=29856 RepID=A0ABY6TXW2_BIOOC|nr:unnamed protein product [Clonostachys rosea]